jgi:class 3 adenylate cyclase/tetratricopeptide (TPR) repeat protein
LARLDAYATMNCPKCQHENRPTARFCGNCASSLVAEISCPSCGESNPPDQKFCDACAAPLTAAAAPKPTAKDTIGDSADPRSYTPKHLADRILTSKNTLEGEHKHVTVLFADVADYTALGERCDAEDLHSLMDRAFRIILDEVHRYEGTVNQFTGDGVMALFGAPVALEGAPRHAVRAALAIQRGLVGLDEEVRGRWDRSFRMRIGIHTGPVVVGKIGDNLRMDYTAVGDTTNLAARLQQAAKPGSVFISTATEQLVHGLVETSDALSLELKGKSTPVEAYEVVGEKAMRSRIEATAEEGLTTLVGRRNELETLQSSFASAMASQGRVVFVVGEAGLGKSRLLYEFRESLEGRDHVWVEGRCASYARNTAFHPIADCVRRYLRIDDNDDDQNAIEKIEASREEFGTDLDWTVPFLRHLLSLPAGDQAVLEMDAATRRSETARALVARSHRLAEKRPLILVIEDLHWIDRESEQFLGYLSESVPSGRMLFLLTHRPGYEHPFGDRSYHVRLALQPLGTADMDVMTRALLKADDIPQELQSVIARKAEGNPFFVEEVTKSLVEEGALERTDTGMRLARRLDQISIPDSIQDVLMARLDRLDTDAKLAIQTASIIGREFALGLLDRIIELGKSVPSVVDGLRALELIYEKRNHPELAYMFKHALTHDVAYHSVLVQRRRELHALVARAIEELYPDRLPEHYEALAHHFVRGRDWSQALHYLELAAEKATEAYANASAADLLRQAVSVCESLGDEVPAAERARIESRLAQVLGFLSEFREAAEHYEAASEWLEDSDEKCVSLCLASYHYHWAHDYEHDEKRRLQALNLAREHGSEVGQAFAVLLEGFMAGTQRGDLDTFERLTDEALARAKHHPAVSASGRQFRGMLAEWKGDYNEALPLLQSAVVDFRALKMTDFMSLAAWFLGISATCVGRYGDALSLLGESSMVVERIGLRTTHARLLNTMGWCYGEIGAHDRSELLNRRSLEIAAICLEEDLVAGADELYANAGINLAGNMISVGDFDGAEEVLAPIRKDLEVSTDPWQRWRYSMNVDDAVSHIEFGRGHFETAFELARRVVSASRKNRSRKIEGRAMTTIGRIHLATDAREDAATAIDNALEVGRTLGHPPLIWRNLFSLAELERRNGNAAAAETADAEARALISTLARPLGDPKLTVEFNAMADRLAADAKRNA